MESEKGRHELMTQAVLCDVIVIRACCVNRNLNAYGEGNRKQEVECVEIREVFTLIDAASLLCERLAMRSES